MLHNYEMREYYFGLKILQNNDNKYWFFLDINNN